VIGSFVFAGGGNDVEISLIATDGVTPVLRSISQAMGAFSGDATRMVSSLAQLGAVALPIMAIGGAFIYAGQQAAMVQQNVANLNAVLHATGEQLAAIRNNGLALSQATQFTDAQILASQRQLAKGGATATDLAQGGSQGVTGATLNLAAATQSTTVAAATSMTTASSAFNIPIQDAAKTATILSSAVDSSVGSLANQATALKQVGVVARAAGFDLKDTVTTIADLQNSGMLNDSGTGLKTFLSRIEAPSGVAKQQIDALGLSFYDLQGKLKPIPEIFDEIHTKMMGLDQQTANDALTKIFGLRGVRVADVALEQGSSGYIDTAQSMAEKGDASEIAARKLNTFQGSVSKAVSSLNTLAVQFGTTLLPGMKSFADMTEHAANALSGLNNNVGILPQLAVGVGAITGISKFGSYIDHRQDASQTASKSVLDKANQARITSAADYSHAVAAAEFEADSKIAAAHANMVKSLEELDKQQYDAWIALQEKTADIMASNEQKNIASIKRITDATLASIAETQSAQADAAAKTIARAEVTADTQRKLLAISAADQNARAAFPVAMAEERQVAPAVVVRQLNQEQDKKVLEAQIAVRKEAAQEMARIDAQYNAESLVRTVDKGQQEIAEVVKAASAERSAEDAKYAQSLAAQAEYNAKSIDMVKAKTAAEEAAIASTAMGKLGTGVNYLSVGGVNSVPNRNMVAGSISEEASAIKVPANVLMTAGTVAADTGLIATLKSRTGTAIKGVTGLLGDLVVPVLIAATVVEMVIKPIEQAIIDKAVKNDPQLQDINASVNLITQGRGPGSADTLSYADQVTSQAQARQNIQDAIDQKQAQLDEAKKAGGQLLGTAGGPTVPGAQGLNDLAAKAGFVSADVGALQKEIDSLNQSLKTVDAQGKQTELMPQAALSKANDTMTALLANIDNGTMSVDQFTVAWKEETAVMGGRTAELEKAGVSQEKANALDREAIDLAKQHQKAVDDAKQQVQADYVNNANDAVSFRALGASPDLADVAAFGQHTDQTAATKVEVADAKKEITELRTAWTGAQTVINGIDITKGFDAFAKLADSISLANRELANVGQSNSALLDLGHYADMFKQVTDAETAASAAMAGYNLTLDQSNTYMTKLSGVQKEFETALEQAERRQAAGRATSADTQLIAESPNIRANLSNQQDTISQHMVLDVLGTVHNLPDFASLDSYMRDIVEKGGGGINIAATITSDAKTARQEIENILKPDLHVKVILDPDITQFNPALLDSIKNKTYGAAIQTGTYNDQGGSAGGSGADSRYAGQAPPFPGPGQAGQYAFGSNNPGGAQSNAYAPMSYADYQKVLAQYPGSPIADRSSFDTLQKVAQQGDIDPRILMGVMQTESQYGTTAGKIGKQYNYGGMGVNDRLWGHDSGIHATDGGPEYEGYSSYESFLRDEAALININGGDFSKYQTADQGQAKQKAIADLRNKIPVPSAVDPYGSLGFGAGGSQYGQGTINSSENLTTAQSLQQQNDINPASTVSAATATGFDPQSILSAARKHLGEMTQIDGEPWYLWCEKFVDNAVQEATGLNYRGHTADEHVKQAEAGVAGAGKVIDKSQARPGDLVGWEASGGSGMSQGHIGVYAGGNQYVGTTENGVQIRDLMPGAVFIRPDGVVANGPVPGSVAYNGNAPGTVNAAQTPAYAPLTTRIQPTTEQSAAFAGYGNEMGKLDAQGQGTVEAFLNKIVPAFTSLSAEKGLNGQTFGYNRTSDPNATEKQQIDNNGLETSYTLATKYGVAIDAVNNRLPVTAQMYKDINAAAGPFGNLIEAQARATVSLAQETQHLTDLKQQQADADTKHQKDVQDRQNTETQISNAHTWQGMVEQQQQRDTTASRLVITRREQDEDTARQRKQTLDQRAIDDSRTAQSRAWQDEQTQLQDKSRIEGEMQRQADVADTNHKQALDDAYTTLQRQEQDQQRMLQFRGGQQMIDLQDARKTLDDQHRISTEGMQQNEGLYVSLGKGSSTEAQATAYASQAAAIDDARKKADDLYAKQSEANTRAQDALSKYNAQVIFDLQTQQIAADRAHQDAIKNIDEEASKRHQDYSNHLYDLSVEAAARTASHLTITRQEEDEDKARTRGYEDTQFHITATRTAEQRQWQDEDTRRTNMIQDEQNRWTLEKIHRDQLAKQDDDKYAADKLANQQEQTDTQKNITDIGKVLSGIDGVIAKVGVLIGQFGVAAVAASGMLNIAPTSSGNSGNSTYLRRLGGFATGTSFSPAGDAQVNEQGGEMRTLLSGETIIPADETKRMFDAMISARTNVTPISAAPSYHEGNITIQMGDSNIALSSAAQARIRQIVQDEVASQQPTTYTARLAATGGMKR
jgi:TP901 family phage tail tape measure protein